MERWVGATTAADEAHMGPMAAFPGAHATVKVVADFLAMGAGGRTFGASRGGLWLLGWPIGHACVLWVVSRQRVQRVLVHDLPGLVNATA